MDYQNMIICPLLTEKTDAAREKNKYYFQVHPSVNKLQVKQALKKLFKVDVLSCNIIRVKGKKSTNMRTGKQGYCALVKKAIVSLKPGSQFDFYE